MTELKEGVIDRVKDYNNWVRIFFMLAYGLVLLYIVVPIVAVVMIAQVLCTFGGGRLNSNLTEFGESLVVVEGFSVTPIFTSGSMKV